MNKMPEKGYIFCKNIALVAEYKVKEIVNIDH